MQGIMPTARVSVHLGARNLTRGKEQGPPPIRTRHTVPLERAAKTRTRAQGAFSLRSGTVRALLVPGRIGDEAHEWALHRALVWIVPEEGFLGGWRVIVPGPRRPGKAGFAINWSSYPPPHETPRRARCPG